MIAVFGGPISRRDDVIDSQWDSRIRRILETVPYSLADSHDALGLIKGSQVSDYVE